MIDMHHNLVHKLNMETIRRQKVGKYIYWQIVVSRRVNGKPRPFLPAHLGTAIDELVIARLKSNAGLRRAVNRYVDSKMNLVQLYGNDKKYLSGKRKEFQKEAQRLKANRITPNSLLLNCLKCSPGSPTATTGALRTVKRP
ncbi:MAG TPA: hypothetical protein VLH18_05035 [Candidatus Limnocylindrales bacterium]|nr:hypothetical protein [Candidatus Limnocylindrales bacterium]